LGRDETVGFRRIQGKDALVEENHVLERRWQLEMQARLVDDFLDLTQGEDNGVLALIDYEQGRAQQHQRDQDGDRIRNEAAHYLTSLSRAARLSRLRASAGRAGSSACIWSEGAGVAVGAGARAAP